MLRIASKQSYFHSVCKVELTAPLQVRKQVGGAGRNRSLLLGSTLRTPLGGCGDADPLRGELQDTFGSFDCVLHEHGHGHRSDTSGNRGDESGLLLHS